MMVLVNCIGRQRGFSLKEKLDMTNLFKELFADESGATAIEYGLIAALVSVAAIAALTALGGSLRGIFGAASASLDGAVTTAAATGGSAAPTVP